MDLDLYDPFEKCSSGNSIPCKGGQSNANCQSGKEKGSQQFCSEDFRNFFLLFESTLPAPTPTPSRSSLVSVAAPSLEALLRPLGTSNSTMGRPRVPMERL